MIARPKNNFFFYGKHPFPPFLLCAIFPSIMRVLSSLSEMEDWTTPPQYRSTTLASDRTVIYRVCMRERPYLGAYAVPAGCRYRDMGKLKFYDDTTDDCMCPLQRTYVPRTGDTLIPPLEFVSWHWFELSCSSLLALHVRAKWLSYSSTYTASSRALFTWFLMRIGRRFAKSKQQLIRFCEKSIFRTRNFIQRRRFLPAQKSNNLKYVLDTYSGTYTHIYPTQAKFVFYIVCLIFKLKCTMYLSSKKFLNVRSFFLDLFLTKALY